MIQYHPHTQYIIITEYFNLLYSYSSRSFLVRHHSQFGKPVKLHHDDVSCLHPIIRCFEHPFHPSQSICTPKRCFTGMPNERNNDPTSENKCHDACPSSQPSAVPTHTTHAWPAASSGAVPRQGARMGKTLLRVRVVLVFAFHAAMPNQISKYCVHSEPFRRGTCQITVEPQNCSFLFSFHKDGLLKHPIRRRNPRKG